MSRWRRSGLSLCVLAVIWPSTSDAFVRTMTCRINADPRLDPLACADGEAPVPIFWDLGCVVVHTNERGSADVDRDAVYRAVDLSLEAWNGIGCSYMSLISGGLTDENRVGYNSCDPALNANVVMFVNQGWAHQAQALALTSVTYDMRTGVIVDADMELNDQNFNFTTTDVDQLIRIDVRNTVTHELGHLLGLDHTDVSDATMFATAPTGETRKRTLHDDDIAGMCAIYPAGTGPVCSPVGMGFFSKPVDGPGSVCKAESDCGCRAAGRADRPGTLPFLVAALTAFVAVRRRSPARLKSGEGSRGA